MIKRIVNGLKIAVALPVYQLANLLTSADKGWLAKTTTLVLFLPIFVFTTTCWAAIWFVVLWLAFRQLF
jgi:hypothetical protein